MEASIKLCIEKYNLLSEAISAFIIKYEELGIRHLGQKWQNIKIEHINFNFQATGEFIDKFSQSVDHLMQVRDVIFDSGLKKAILYNVSTTAKNSYAAQENALILAFSTLEEAMLNVVVEPIDVDYENSSKTLLMTKFYIKAIENSPDRDKLLESAKCALLNAPERKPLQVPFIQQLLVDLKPSTEDPTFMSFANRNIVYNIKTLCMPTKFKRNSGLNLDIIKQLDSIYDTPITSINEISDCMTFDGLNAFEIPADTNLPASELELLRIQDEIIGANISVQPELPVFNNKILIDTIQLKAELLKEYLEDIKAEKNPFFFKVPFANFIGRSFRTMHRRFFDKSITITISDELRAELWHTHFTKILQNITFFTDILKKNYEFPETPTAEDGRIMISKIPTLNLTY